MFNMAGHVDQNVDLIILDQCAHGVGVDSLGEAPLGAWNRLQAFRNVVGGITERLQTIQALDGASPRNQRRHHVQDDQIDIVDMYPAC